MSTKFAVDDRVVVMRSTSLTNLVGRKGRIVSYIPENMAGPEMFEVRIDNLRLASDVPFYEFELSKLHEAAK